MVIDKKALNDYDAVCKKLDSFVEELSSIIDPDVENQQAVCTLDCCMLSSVAPFNKFFLIEFPELTAKIIGISGMKLLDRFVGAFNAIIDKSVDYDLVKEKLTPGWSNRCDWIELVGLTTHLKRHIERKLEQNKQHSGLRYKYSVDYLVTFVNQVKDIAQDTIRDPEDFFVRSEFILHAPDEYEGLSWSLFNLISLLYSLLQSTYAGKIEAGYKGHRYRDTTNTDWDYQVELRHNVCKLDERIAQCAQLIIDEFEKINS
jgi:hypothetical protein